MWFLENYLSDLHVGVNTKEGIVKYERCVRVLQEVQMAVWGDTVKPVTVRRSSKEYASSAGIDAESDSDVSVMFKGIDTLPSVEATLVGFGCILASIASPMACNEMKPLVLMEARKKDRFRQQFAGHSRSRTIKPVKKVQSTQTTSHKPILVPLSSTFPSIEDLSQGKAFSLKDAITKTARQMRNSPPLSSNTSADTRPVLYYHPEMQFTMSLIDISRRLCFVPGKEGRQQALQAELSLLNHNLPASLCIPLWCNGHDDGQIHGHHRILRIPSCEAVILNSAERVPFCIYVEIVKDLDDTTFQSKVISISSKTPSSGSPPALRSRSETIEQIPMSPRTIKTPKSRSKSGFDLPSPLPEVPLSALGTAPTFPLDQPFDKDDFSERMRTAAIMLAQLTRQATQPDCPTAKLADINAIKAKLISEMEALEKSRLLDALQTQEDNIGMSDLYTLGDGKVQVKDDPSAAVFGETWDVKRARIKESSPYGNLPGWDLLSVIVKAGSDMRQEQLACQIIEEMHDLWNMAGLPIWVYPFRILVAAAEGGLVETVKNAISIHSIKKNAYTTRPSNEPYSLRDHYIRTFGSPDSDTFINARDAFVKSLAGYSLITYLLQLRDRHNGNILIDAQGHMIHIDFGFMLANFPGGYYGFESAPFKLSSEYIDLLGGLHSEPFAAFKELMFHGFMALRKHADRLFLLLEIAQKNSKLPCFGSSGPTTIAQLRQRFQLGLTEQQVRLFVDRMITGSAYNVFTRLYDSYQYYSNGIL